LVAPDISFRRRRDLGAIDGWTAGFDFFERHERAGHRRLSLFPKTVMPALDLGTSLQWRKIAGSVRR
jgi:hypothetical protein